MHVKQAVQRGIWVENSSFALGPKRTTGTLDIFGWSQELLASSPALVSPYVALALFEQKRVYVFVF
jgi:hypothetical protein